MWTRERNLDPYAVGVLYEDNHCPYHHDDSAGIIYEDAPSNMVIVRVMTA